LKGTIGPRAVHIVVFTLSNVGFERAGLGKGTEVEGVDDLSFVALAADELGHRSPNLDGKLHLFSREGCLLAVYLVKCGLLLCGYEYCLADRLSQHVYF
jgi:hypothetical protein